MTYQQISMDSKSLGMDILEKNNWPQGLKEQMVANWDTFPYRFMVLDDSGSMGHMDGTKLMSSGRIMKSINCSRWDEMGDAVKFHAELADMAKAPTEFCFLNASNPIVVGETEDDGQAKNKVLKILSSGPSGGTPLCRVLNGIHAKIKQMAPELRERGQKVSLTIFTDGKASDGNLQAVMQKFAHLPVWVVIRLCTNDDDVGDYWSGIDDNIELEMDVLDDLRGEAMEVTKFNPWLTYGQPLHYLRESGCKVKVLDKLDEARLMPSEIRAICPVILGGTIDDYVHPDVDMAAFKGSIDTMLNRSPDVWDPLARCQSAWIKTNKLAGGGCCTIA